MCVVVGTLVVLTRLVYNRVHRTRREAKCHAACMHIVPRQGALFVMLHHYRDAHACARMCFNLLRTAVCPGRIFIGVFQELVEGDPGVTEQLASLGVPRAEQNVRVITQVVSPGTHASGPHHCAVELTQRCMRSERTGVLLGDGVWASDGWDERLVDELTECRASHRHAVLTADPPTTATTPTAFPCWVSCSPTLACRPRAFTGNNTGPACPVIAASTMMCTAPASVWQRLARDARDARDAKKTRPTPDGRVALSAGFYRIGGHMVAPQRHLGLTGGLAGVHRADDSSSACKHHRQYLRWAGVDVRRHIVSGRARLGVTGVASTAEVRAKYGSREAFDLQREAYA